MSTSNDISNMFDKKNKEMFFEKLNIDLDNNTDGLRQTIKYKIIMEYSQLSSFLKKFLLELDVDFSDDDLKHILTSSLNELSKNVNELIEERSTKYKKHISSTEYVDENYVQSYSTLIDDVSAVLNEHLGSQIRKEISVNLYEALITKLLLPSKESKDILMQRCSAIVAPSLLRKISDDLKYRDLSLKNMLKESFGEYLCKVEISDQYSQRYDAQLLKGTIKKGKNKTQDN